MRPKPVPLSYRRPSSKGRPARTHDHQASAFVRPHIGAGCDLCRCYPLLAVHQTGANERFPGFMLGNKYATESGISQRHVERWEALAKEQEGAE